MRTERHSIKGYKINYSTNTISLNYKFAKSAQDFGSPEYSLLKQLREELPVMTIVVEAGRKINTTNLKKRLTYDNIEKHINAYSNSTELLENFYRAIELSKPLASPYKYVCDWFYSQFPEYDNPIKSIFNSQTSIELVALPDDSKYTKKAKKEIVLS